MKKFVFITRDLADDSVFHTFDKEQVEIISYSLINFKTVPIATFPIADCIFFYSQNGVQHFFKSFHSDIFIKENTSRIACMGYGTGDAFSKITKRKADFIGSGKPKDVAKQLDSFLSRKSDICFITAADSLHSVSKLLPKVHNQQQIIAYQNNYKREVIIPSADYFLITSPKNGIALNKAGTNHKGTIITIGRTTAGSMHNQGIKELVIATHPSEQGMFNALKLLL